MNVSRNPNPGVLINRPNGPNVYNGVIKDYTGNVSLQLPNSDFIYVESFCGLLQSGVTVMRSGLINGWFTGFDVSSVFVRAIIRFLYSVEKRNRIRAVIMESDYGSDLVISK